MQHGRMLPKDIKTSLVQLICQCKVWAVICRNYVL